MDVGEGKVCVDLSQPPDFPITVDQVHSDSEESRTSPSCCS